MESEDRVARLTERQRECLRRVYLRFQIGEIAGELGIAPTSVKDHLQAARRHLGDLTSAAAAARALAEFEGAPDPLTRRPPPRKTAADAPDPPPKPVAGAPFLPPSAAHEGRRKPLAFRDGSVAPIYVPESARASQPAPLADEGATNDLDWQGKLLRALLIALVAVWLLGSIIANMR